MKNFKFSVFVFIIILLTNVIFMTCTVPEVKDKTPPTCEIIYPVPGQAISGTVVVRIGATDNNELDRTLLYIDGELAATLKGHITEYVWDTQPVADNQDHSIYAVAFDKEDNAGFSGAITVRVVSGVLPDTTAPTIAILNPIDKSVVEDTVNVITQVQDDSRVIKVEFFIDGYLRYTTEASPFNYQWVVTNLIDGSVHSLFARAFDENLNQSYSNVVRVTIKSNIVIDNEPPAVGIIYPTNGVTVKDTTEILVNVTDNIGIDRLQFFADGQLQSTITSSPWRFLWDVTGLVNGSQHKIFIIAFDTNQNQGVSQEINVIVQSDIIEDIIPPSIFLSYPPDGAVLTGTTTIIATANDNVAVINVEFYFDGTLIGNDETPPYEHILDISGLQPNSTHTLYAIAYDGAENITQTPLQSVSIAPKDLIPPTVQIINPNNGATITNDIVITAQAQDQNGVTFVEFFINGVLVGNDSISPYTYNWSIMSLPNNSVQTLFAKAYDAAGNVGNSTLISVTILNQDIIPPTVTILYPTEGSQFSAGTIVTISADAQDNIGIDKVEFYIDGDLLATVTQAPYKYDWDTTNYGDGQNHSIYLKAYDQAGNVGTQLITVIINP